MADGIQGLVGDGAAMRGIRDLIARVAPTPSTVLITGESGSGKEVVARAIHALSAVRGIFLAVNCAAIPTELLESQLFGHVRGAFTGALTAQEGLFARARGGTLFLDEIGELPLTLQAKLLRAIEEKEILPVGAVEQIGIDVRLIAATNRDLERLVAEGRFREDLYYRLDVVNLRLPPLRERPEDIPALVEQLIRRHNLRIGRAYRGADAAAVKMLTSQQWKGNVRELDHIIERAMVVGDGDMITARDLTRALGDRATTPGDDAREALRLYERLHTEGVLRRCNNDRNQAAELLGLSPSALERRLDDLGLRR
jgi:transcriptional regulator with PAS, ATPase and Fis domain